MDFLGPLPLALDGCDMILVLIDRTTRRAHLWPCKSTDTAQDIALLLGERYVPLHGIPITVSTDRDSKFMSEMFQAIIARLGIIHKTSTSFHKEPNGLVERMNRTIGEMLRNFTNANPQDWRHWVPLIELSINSARLANADYTPFELDCGQNPIVEPVFAPLTAEVPHDSVDALTEILRQRRSDIKQLWQEAIRHSKELYDEKHKPMKFKVGDKVMISTQDITEFKQKLSRRWVGPAEVLEVKPEAETYRLKLPKVVERIHDWIHVSRLKPYTEPIEPVAQPGPVKVNGDEEWEIERIERASYFKKSGLGWRYLIKWKGYADSQWFWAHELPHAQDLIAEYHAKHPRPIKPERAQRVPKQRLHERAAKQRKPKSTEQASKKRQPKTRNRVKK
jgi:hypothetical protein